MLHVEIPSVYVRRLEILSDAHDRAWASRRRAAIDRACRKDSAAADIIPIESGSWKSDEPGCDGPRARRYANSGRRNRGETYIVVQRKECFPIHGFIDDAGPAANHGLVVARNIPREAQTRSQVVRIEVVRAADSFAHLHKADIRNEICQLIAGIFNDRAEFIAQAEIQSQMTGDAPVVLDKQRSSPVVNMSRRIAGQKAAIRRRTGEEVLDGRRGDGAVKRSKGIATEELETSTRSTISTTVEAIAMFFDAEFQGVLSDRPGDLIHELKAVVGPLNLWPIKSTNSRNRKSKESEDINTWQATVQRIRYPSIQPIGCRRYAVIIGECRLVKAVIAESSLVDPRGRRGPDPVQADDLSSGVN